MLTPSPRFKSSAPDTPAAWVASAVGRFGCAAAMLVAGIVSAPAWAQAPAAETAPLPETEPYMARFQTTYNAQRHPAFAAAYSGPNSILPASGTMYTFSASAFLGFRPWADGEVYLDPEIVQGVPFSGALVGVGGFTNGEITRAAGPTPTVYRQRLFLRQTWNQGGGRVAVESDENQLGGAVDHDRVVLTAGNFSTLDVFDNNTYAKDPRTQFMNWGNWTYAAYDYAADARGYGWGAALEWYVGDWAWRAGRMTGPILPNVLPVDFKLWKHYGDQFEGERAYQLAGEPGKVRVLGYHDRGIMASFSDALAWLHAHPGSYAGPDALYGARVGDKNKYGLGVNVEQALGDRAGLFMRVMKSDGRTETFAFTEVDSSLSSGFLLQGALWGRGDDSAGVSYMQNRASAQRRAFLAAGGTSFFLGDGALNYRPESIVESFYRVGIAKSLWLTGDVQRIANPGYNADRGPMWVFAVMLHAEYF